MEIVSFGKKNLAFIFFHYTLILFFDAEVYLYSYTVEIFNHKIQCYF